ncbi:DUF1573 domain-containing protein [Snuella sedimenti]|uniref:DUF1573 domain-containing protein n=1 Tax=Snuella sedimenti TaxID=2798802 RepID=A0A8J7JBM9_9FLAO|nr:DUF1573 domain-containing protein [Snuella sedimenti]MBJ6368134.1 DUF1573 domain-containing protein [Snuella sedimenti]
MTFSTYNFKTLQSKFLLIFCLLVYTSSFSQQASTTTKNIKAGVLSFETEEIDYGTIQQNANGERTFKFTNTGKAPIVITNVKTSCGCTVPSYAKTPILPGDSSEIKIKYATNRIGIFKKTITIISNASESSKTLRIKGEVLKPEAPKS